MAESTLKILNSNFLRTHSVDTLTYDGALFMIIASKILINFDNKLSKIIVSLPSTTPDPSRPPPARSGSHGLERRGAGLLRRCRASGAGRRPDAGIYR